MAAIQPERTLVRKALPLFPAAVVVSYIAGSVIAGSGAGASAAIAVSIVILNFAGSGLALAWSARISPAAIYGVVMGGFFVKLLALAGALLALRTQSWFSTSAFLAAFVPSTMGLLVYEMRVLSGPIQADLWYFRDRPS